MGNSLRHPGSQAALPLAPRRLKPKTSFRRSINGFPFWPFQATFTPFVSITSPDTYLNEFVMFRQMRMKRLGLESGYGLRGIRTKRQVMEL